MPTKALKSLLYVTDSHICYLYSRYLPNLLDSSTDQLTSSLGCQLAFLFITCENKVINSLLLTLQFHPHIIFPCIYPVTLDKVLEVFLRISNLICPKSLQTQTFNISLLQPCLKSSLYFLVHARWYPGFHTCEHKIHSSCNRVFL